MPVDLSYGSVILFNNEINGIWNHQTQKALAFGQNKCSRNEGIESIDMLRILDNGKKLGIDIIKGEVENIDVKSDIPKVIKLLKNDLLVKKYS